MNNLRRKIVVLGAVIFMGIGIIAMLPEAKDKAIYAIGKNINKISADKAYVKKAKEEVKLVKKIVLRNVKDQYVVLKKGSTKSMKLSITPPDASNRKLSWSSSNDKVAVVSEKGVVLGKNSGTAKITAATRDGSNKKIVFNVEVIPTTSQVYRDGFYYHGITKNLKKRMEGKSYQENSYISYGDLRYVRVKHYNYAGKVKTGELIVNKKIAKDMVEIFYQLYRKKYPIQKMVLIDEYKGNDIASMKANNTSAFNYRVIEGSSSLSNHAYGMAIDINPKINPYVSKGGRNISPNNGRVYAIRNIKKCKGKYKGNMIQKGDFIYRLFKKHGFKWGGDWNSIKDYQHFEKVVH